MLEPIHLFTPLHSGTHFMRLLLEAHPEVEYMNSTHWAPNQLKELGYEMPDKCPQWKLKHRHAGWDYMPPEGETTICTLRDPLSSLITSARRREDKKDKWVYLEEIARGYSQVRDLCESQRATYVAVDRHDTVGAIFVLNMLALLPVTRAQKHLLESWPKIKSTGNSHPMQKIPKGVLNGLIALMNEYDLQTFFYNAGYRDLEWFLPF